MTAEPTTATPAPTAQPRTRRQALCGLMIALVAPGALIAACGAETDSGSTVDNPNTPTSGSNGSSAPGGSLAAVADIPDGGGKLVDNPAGGQVLLVRTGSEVTAFDPTCPHQGATVEPPENGVITCRRHGSTFTSSDGAVTQGPARTGLKTVAVTVEGGNVLLG
ncbi:Rieske (2Fe-2S) protein [Actinokineospora pegani]|uniref:Rieske (2Fe-2S) protein n=1 Tax=Actinokineospora pegani TaxID=2654637 RepID=UPI001F169DFF|nr:Rieske (2Fe-2S) protein [Actinokineospora pegani]